MTRRIQFLFKPIYCAWMLLLPIALVGFQPRLLAHGLNPIDIEPSVHTINSNREFSNRLPLHEDGDFRQAHRGLIARWDRPTIDNVDGSPSVFVKLNDFIEGTAPNSVNPSLWRHAKLNKAHGLYEITPGVYQLRGYDAANMTVVEGKTGWIVIDPLLTPAPVRAGLQLLDEHVKILPVTAILFTHSHQDHFGGTEGVLERAIADVPMIAPANFYQESLQEHVLAGPHMDRRFDYQAGRALKPGPRGWVGFGLSQQFSQGESVLPKPTKELNNKNETLFIDGIQFDFVPASGTEATSEFLFYIPQYQVLQSAEVVSGVQHNVLTPRGARVRDTLLWSKVIDQLLIRFGASAEYLVASHNPPVFGNELVQRKLRNHRNLYRYIHDQTLRRANNGMTMHEITDDVEEPHLMQSDFSTRPYYGNFKHNIRAVYQLYYGWWGGVPANLDPLPPVELGNRYIAALGGADNILAIATRAHKEGDYRWAATLLNHLVFADPGNQDGRQWLARTYQQLGYQQESGIYRNIYLSAAKELLQDKRKIPFTSDSSHYPLSIQGDILAIRYNPQQFDHAPFVINFRFNDSDQVMALDVGKDVLYPRTSDMANADFEISIDRDQWLSLVEGNPDFEHWSESKQLHSALSALVAALDDFDRSFNIIEP